MKKFTLLFSTLLAGLGLSAQKAYFQQNVKYEIHVKLDDVHHQIRADEKLEYTNNSPDALPYIWMHLWPNAYRDNKTALGQQLKENGELNFYFGGPEERGRIDSLNFKVNDQPANLVFEGDTSDMAKLMLATPLQPGQTITITTPFRVTLPNGDVSRMGHIGQQYQVTQWYPKPAVYDRNGWNNIPYLDQGEFYSEFGSYDVYITLPKNYVVGATGNLQNADELQWLDQLSTQATAKETYDKKDNAFPRSSTEWKTLNYKQSNVHDFGWFCDKRYNVLKGEVTLPHSKRKVTTFVMYTNQYGDLWKKSIPYVNDAIYYYSLWNGDYQYDYCTAVDGALSAGGGMEYPNVTVIGGVSSDFMLETVIMHEVGHNWFYGMLGSNERVHGWMDEGMNSANELRYVATKYPSALLLGNTGTPKGYVKTFDMMRYPHRAQYYQLYHLTAAVNTDQPIELHSTKYTTINYAAIMYYKTAVVFDYMRGYLGDSIYDKCMQTYFDRWHFKHPMPEDLRSVFEEITKKDLSWFFNDMIQTTKKLDYKITSVKRRDDRAWDIEVKNTGDIKGPVSIYGIKDDKVRGVVWYEGFDGSQTLSFPESDIDYFRIDYMENMPEINRKNNTEYTHGLFRKAEPLRLQFLGSLDNPTRTQLFYTPTIGYNMYNGFMLGAAVYNHVAPMKHVEWHVMPMYGTRNKDVAGAAGLFVNLTPKKVFQQVSIGVNASRWAWANEPLENLDYNKIAPEINFIFRKKELRNPVKQSVRLRGIHLTIDDVLGDYHFTPPTYGYTTRTLLFEEALYKLENKRHINPFDISVELQRGGESGYEMMKGSITANYSLTIKKKKSIDFRLFAGSFLGTSTLNAGPYRFRMGAWHGFQDYTFDHTFIGRSETEGFWSQQMAEEEGNFKVPTYYGQSAQWLTALNIKAPSFLLSSVKLFADFGVCAKDGMPDDVRMLYDAGFNISIGKNFLNIYLPVLMSKPIKDEFSANDVTFGKQIRFSINLASPFKLIDSLNLF